MTFDALVYLRALERAKHADLAKELGALITALGYDQETHAFLHAEKFKAVMGMYPSVFFVYLHTIFTQVSHVAEDHITEEGLAILNLVLQQAIADLRRSGLPLDQTLGIHLQNIARSIITEWVQEKGQSFQRDDHIGEQFTLAQARAYIVRYADQYQQLPEKDTIDE